MIMWAIQIFLAVAFGAAGTMKLVRSKARLAANPHMGWVHSVPEARSSSGCCGGARRDRPGGTDGNRNRAVPDARCRGVLAALMGGAVATHMNRREPAAVATALAALTIVVATFR